MKLLIDIPEHIYEHAKEMTEDSRDEGKAMRAIANGSPLSKGHGDFIAEKERLIKKDIASIENKVRHVFNQGYEMGMKESRSEIPNTCEDAISRKAAIDLADELKDDLPDDDRLSDMVMSHNEGILDYQTKLSLLPSVTPQPKTGHWKRISIDKYSEHAHYWYRCDKCGKDNLGNTDFCPKCGCKMEVE